MSEVASDEGRRFWMAPITRADYDALYLVTGGASLIGSNLVDTLVVGGAGVRVLDNLSTGRCEKLLSRPRDRMA